MKGMITAATLTGAAALTIAAPAAPAQAAWPLFGGHAKNVTTSTLSVPVVCHNGDVWHLRPGSQDSCGDVDAFLVPATGRTYRLDYTTNTGDPVWRRQSVGRHGVGNLRHAVLKRIR